MSEADFGSLALLLFLLIAAAHVLGYLFTRLRQPRRALASNRRTRLGRLRTASRARPLGL